MTLIASNKPFTSTKSTLESIRFHPSNQIRTTYTCECVVFHDIAIDTTNHIPNRLDPRCETAPNFCMQAFDMSRCTLVKDSDVWPFTKVFAFVFRERNFRLLKRHQISGDVEGIIWRCRESEKKGRLGYPPFTFSVPLSRWRHKVQISGYRY